MGTSFFLTLMLNQAAFLFRLLIFIHKSKKQLRTCIVDWRHDVARRNVRLLRLYYVDTRVGQYAYSDNIIFRRLMLVIDGSFFHDRLACTYETSNQGANACVSRHFPNYCTTLSTCSTSE
jgi:hypothetical protein